MEQQSSPSTASDLVAAIAERNFGQANASVADYRLVHAQRLLAGGEHCSDTSCWRLTFKLARLIPTSQPALIGVGGELFFRSSGRSRTEPMLQRLLECSRAVVRSDRHATSPPNPRSARLTSARSPFVTRPRRRASWEACRSSSGASSA